MKEIAELREFLNKKIEELQKQKELIEQELTMYKGAMAEVDSILLKGSFTTAADLYEIQKAEAPKKKAPEPPLEEPAPSPKADQIKATDGTILGELSVGGDALRIIPNQTLAVTGDEPPLRSFFIGKILTKMQAEDEDLIKNKQLTADSKFAFTLKKNEKGVLEEISIANYRTTDRLNELRRTIIWSLSKIHEKR